MSERLEIERAINLFIEAINRNDSSRIPLTDDAVMSGPMMAEPTVGAAAVRAYLDEHHWWADALGRAALAAGPETPRDHLAAAYVLHAAQEYGPAADLFTVALGDPDIAADLRNGHRYNGACAAALAGRTDVALSWLAADLRQRRARLDPVALDGFLEHVRVNDPDLASLRGTEDSEALFR